MLTVEYSAKGKVVSDFRVEVKYIILLDQIKKAGDNDLRVAYASECMIHRIRLGIVRGDIDHDKVVFEFEGRKLRPNHHARIEGWPDGFADLSERIGEATIDAEPSIFRRLSGSTPLC